MVKRYIVHSFYENGEKAHELLVEAREAVPDWSLSRLKKYMKGPWLRAIEDSLGCGDVVHQWRIQCYLNEVEEIASFTFELTEIEK